MSTIPITSNNISVPYTIVGGARRAEAGDSFPALSVVVLNRGGRFQREDLLSGIGNRPDAEVIYIEDSGLSYDIESLSRKHPGIRFLFLQREITIGERINLGAVESRSPYVLVLWSDMKPKGPFQPARLLEDIKKNQALCTVPALRNSRQEFVPCIQVPGFMKKTLKVVPWEPRKNEERSLYPFDFSGIYDKEKFFSIGGYDPYLTNPYWQKMDFGFRSSLWGEKIMLNTVFQLEYTVDLPAEDTTPDKSYKLFYLKNIFIRYANGSACLPVRKLVSYCLNSNTDFVSSAREFFTIRKWVAENRYRYKKDARTLIRYWEVLE
jgi:hypothetical protein